MHRLRTVTIEPAKQELRGPPPKRLRVLGDHGDGGIENVGENHIVESKQCHLTLEPDASQSADAADRRKVLAGEQGGRRIRERKQLLDRLRGELRVSKTRPDQVLVDGNACARECLLVPPQSLTGSEDGRKVAEEGNASVAVAEQVPDGDNGASDVV